MNICVVQQDKKFTLLCQIICIDVFPVPVRAFEFMC
jgi:hypothetical protein